MKTNIEEEFLINSIFNEVELEEFDIIRKVLKNLLGKSEKELKLIYEFDLNGNIIKIKRDYLSDSKPAKMELYKKYTINKDNSYREIGIPNPILYFMFIYNLKNNKNLFELMYEEDEKYKVLSKIYERNNFIYFLDFYKEDIFFGSYEEDVEAKFVQTTQFFQRSKQEELKLKVQYDYVLHLDISKYYSSIYTHLFDRISGEITNNEARSFVKWLDEFNMSINERETKGIVTGPYSSQICAEILSCAIDHKLLDYLGEKNVKYTRFVDDYYFYSNDRSLLNAVISKFQLILRDYRLETNNKTKITRVSYEPIELETTKVFIHKVLFYDDNIVEPYIDSEKELNYQDDDRKKIEFYVKSKIFTNFELLFNKLIEYSEIDNLQLLKSALSIIKNKLEEEDNYLKNILSYDKEIALLFYNFLIKLLLKKGHVYKYVIDIIEDFICEIPENKIKESILLLEECYPDTFLIIKFKKVASKYTSYEFNELISYDKGMKIQSNNFINVLNNINLTGSNKRENDKEKINKNLYKLLFE